MFNVAIYARKSVYREGSLSVENQINFCKEYISKKYNDTNFSVFEDEGFTGSNTNRPKFLKLMQLVKSKKIDIVVCYKIDRIARNIVDFVNIFDEFQKNNVTLISITEGFDPSTPIGKMLMLFLASFAEMERMNIAQRVKDNNLALAKRGKWSGGGTPLGYKQGNKTLEIDNADAIKEIFKMKADRKGLTEIMEYINNKYNNFLSSKDVLGRIFRHTIYVKSSDLVSDYLKKNNCSVIGNPDGAHSYLKYKDKESKITYMCIAESIEGIIDDVTWLRVQKIADENNKKENSRFSKNYWLTKTLKCPICGNTYMGQTKKWNHKYIKKDGTESIYTFIHDYYMCRDMGKGKYKTCTNTKRIKKEFIESRIEELILSLKKNKNKFNKIYELTETNNYDKDLDYINKKICKLEKQIELLTEKITFATMEVSKILMLQLDKIIVEKNTLLNKRTEIELKNIDIKNNKLNKDTVYDSINEFSKNLSVERKRDLLMNIFESISYDPMNDKLGVTFR